MFYAEKHRSHTLVAFVQGPLHVAQVSTTVIFSSPSCLLSLAISAAIMPSAIIEITNIIIFFSMFYWVSSLHLCHLWESFLCKRSCVFRAFSGNICPPTDFTDLHRWSVCAELNHRLSGNYCANLTTSPSHHHNILSPPHHLNTLSLRTQPSAGLPRTVGTTSLPPAAR